MPRSSPSRTPRASRITPSNRTLPPPTKSKATRSTTRSARSTLRRTAPSAWPGPWSANGPRMMCNYMRFGGCRCDLPAGWLDQAKQVVDGYPRFLDEFERLLSENEILIARTQGIGVLPKQLAINASITGPMLRASGVNYDIRKVDKYGIYDRFPFRVPLGEQGDTFDRFMIRLLEMRESLKILEQALRDIAPGPIMDPKAKIRGFRPKPGEAYGRIEAPKGELGFYLVSDCGPHPHRYRVQ